MVSSTQVSAIAVLVLAANVQAGKAIPNVFRTQVLSKCDSVIMRGESSLYECAELHTKHPKVTVNKDKSVTIAGVPKVCMDEAKAWNSQPNIKALNQVQGTITIQGTDTLTLTGLQPTEVKAFEGLA